MEALAKEPWDQVSRQGTPGAPAALPRDPLLLTRLLPTSKRQQKPRPEQVCGWASPFPSENLEPEQREATAESFFVFSA